MKIAFLGYGTIARMIHGIILGGGRDISVAGAFVRDERSPTVLAIRRAGLSCVTSVAEVLALHPDVVVEAATQDAARSHVPDLLDAGIDVISLSVGAYLDPQTMRRVHSTAQGRLLIPSGALPGLDVVRAAAVGTITTAELETRKHPRALAGAPGLTGSRLDGAEATEVFRGTARQAIRLFPSNTNVAAALSLVGIGPDRTQVIVIADPRVGRNVHTVRVVGDFGSLTARVDCEPSENPRTSLLAARSAVALLDKMGARVQVGT